MRRRAVAALTLAVVTIGAGFGLDAATGDDSKTLGPGIVTVEIDIEYSRFDVEDVAVRAGTLVRFVVTNRDPILHELVVGGDEVHARHRTGTERIHPPVPGEVSVQPGDAALTVYRFDEPGTYVFACHLPGHREYGMEGTITVTR